MPEQSPSTEAAPRVEHYIVYGEGARDSEWAQASSAPLTYSNLSAQQHFQLLQVPPSPHNAIVPVVRIFPAEARPCYVSQHMPINSSHLLPSTSGPANAPSIRSLAPMAPDAASSVPVQHDASAPGAAASAGPRRLSLRGSRMIARPASQPVVPSPSTPAAFNASHDPVSQKPLADNPDTSLPPGVSLPSQRGGDDTHSSHLAARKRPSQTNSADDQVLNNQPIATAGIESASSAAKDRWPHAQSNTEMSRMDSRAVDSRNSKKSAELGSKKSISEQLANKAQAAALSDLLRDRKKRYAPVRSLPPLSSDPAAQALRAAQVQLPKHSSSEQEKQALRDTASVASQATLEMNVTAKTVNGPISEHPLRTTSARSGECSSVRPEAGVSTPGDGRRSAKGKTNPSQAVLPPNEAPLHVTARAEPELSALVQPFTPRDPAVVDYGRGAAAVVHGKVKEEDKQRMTENFDSAAARNEAIPLTLNTAFDRRDGQGERRDETDRQYESGVARKCDTVLERPQRMIDSPEHSSHDGAKPSAFARRAAMRQEQDEAITDSQKSAAAGHGDRFAATGLGTPSKIPVTVNRNSSQVVRSPHLMKNGSSFPLTAKSPVDALAQPRCSSAALKPQLQEAPSFSSSAIPAKRNIPSADLDKADAGRSRVGFLSNVSDTQTKLRSKSMYTGLMKEPFEYCVRLLVRSLCSSATEKGISKEAEARCRQELRSLLQPPPSVGGVVWREESTVKDPCGSPQGGSANLESKHRQGLVSSTKSVPASYFGMATLKQDRLSNERLLHRTEKSSFQRSSTEAISVDKVSPNDIQVGPKQPQKVDTGSDSTSSHQTGALNAILFTFIQWGLSVGKDQAQVKDIAHGARVFVSTCNSLRSPLPGSLWIQDEDLLVHVLNLNKAASTIFFLVRQTNSLTAESASGLRDQSSTLKHLEFALDALRDILVWVRYLSDRIVELWHKYEHASVYGTEVEKFCEGMQRLLKSSSSENKNDGFLAALRDCKKCFPHTRSHLDNEEDGKAFFDRRKTLGEEVRLILRKLGQVCTWCQKQIPVLRDGDSSNRTLDDRARAGAELQLKRPSKEIVRKQPGENVKDIMKGPAFLRSNASELDASQRKTDPRIQRESDSQTPRRSSLHDPNIPIKRKSREIDESKSQSSVTSGNRKGSSRIAIPRKLGQTENSVDGAPDPNVGLMGRKPVKAGTRNVFDTAAFIKDALGVSNKELGKDGQERPDGTKSGSVTPNSNAKVRQRGILRSSSVPINDDAEESADRPLKRRRGQVHVSFVPQLVVGHRDSSIKREEVASLFHDGYDLLGCDNAIQETAVRERADQLSRGSMMALFGYLRSEFIRLKSESERRDSLVPKYVNLNYTPSATKQVNRKLQSGNSFAHHAQRNIQR